MRKPPGDLFIGMIVGDILLSLHWLISASANYNEGVKLFIVSGDHYEVSPWCKNNAILAMTGVIYQFLYDISFVFYQYFEFRNTLEQVERP